MSAGQFSPLLLTESKLITNYLHSFYYSLTIRAGSPKPQPGSPTFAKHRRRIYITVIVAFLLYQLYETDWEIQRAGDFYTDLGVPYDADDRAIQSRFRKLTLIHHPDKLPTNIPLSQKALAEQHYVSLTTARDTLLSPAKRFAYDRLGPGIATDASWARHKSIRDFAQAGLKALVPAYISSAVGLWAFTWLGLLDARGIYWRYLALAALAAVECHAITRPWHSGITLAPTLLNPWVRAVVNTLPEGFARGVLGWGPGWRAAWVRQRYLPFQALRVAHRALVAFFIALSRLGPVLAGAGSEQAGGGEAAQLAMQVSRLEQLVNTNAIESARLLALEAVPFRQGSTAEGAPGTVGGDGSAALAAVDRDPGLRMLREKIKEWFITNTIRQDPEVRQAVERVVEEKRTE